MSSKEIYQVEIPVQLDIDMVAKRLQLGRGKSSRLEEMAREFAGTARSLAHPAAIFRVSRSRVVDDSTVEIDGVVFTSRVLVKLLRDQERVVPFIATIGKELDEMYAPPRDMLQQFALDAVKTVILVNAVEYLIEYVKEDCHIPKAALMNPGEIEDWYITEQKPLFKLFGEAVKGIGVSLTPGGAMKPIKSRSGIIFPNDTGFVSCRLCNQLSCPGRQAEYDPEMKKQFLS